MNENEVLTWLYHLIQQSQNGSNPYYCDCCTTFVERNGSFLEIENTDMTHEPFPKKRFKIIVEEI